MTDDSHAPNIPLRVAVVAYVLMLSGLVGAYIWVATMEIDVSAYVQGPTELIEGEKHAVRGFYLNAPTGRMFGEVDVEVSSEGNLLGSGTTGSHGYFQIQVEPNLPPGDHTLILAARHPIFESYDVQVPIKVLPSSAPPLASQRPANTDDEAFQSLWRQEMLAAIAKSFDVSKIQLTSRLPKEKDAKPRKKPEWEGPFQVDLLPADREIVRGLPNTVYLRVTRKDDGRPVRAKVTLDKVEGTAQEKIKKNHVTDELGLARIELTPVNDQRWSLTVESLEPEDLTNPPEPPTPNKNPETSEPTDDAAKATSATSTGKVSVRTVPAQFSLQLQKNFVEPGDEILGAVDTLHRSGGFMVDLYDGDRWVGAEAYGISAKGGGLKIRMPEDVRSPIMRLQVYESVFEPGKAWDSRYVAVSDAPMSDGCWRALKRVLGLVETLPAHGKWAAAARQSMLDKKGGDLVKCNEWLDASLQTIPSHFEPAPLLVNSQKAERESLEAWKDEVKSYLMILTILALIVGLAGLLALIEQGLRVKRQQNAAIRAVDAELEGEDYVESNEAKWQRIGTIARSIILVGTVVMFGMGVVLILTLL